MTMEVNYQKRKNSDLFKCLEKIGFSETQNYIPIYNRFFALNETNYDSVNFNHQLYITHASKTAEKNLYKCKVKNASSQKTTNVDIFFKMAPILDPFKYLIGKYDIKDANLFKLPTHNSREPTTPSKYLDPNNSAYVDSLFLFLSSRLIHTHKFIHGVNFYGSFLSIKQDFVLNVVDDLEYLKNSDFFNHNKNVLFTIEDYEHLLENNRNQKRKPLQIEHNSSAHSTLSFQSLNDGCFDNIFDDTANDADYGLNELDDFTFKFNEDSKITTLRSESSCSSRSSHTSHNSCDESECEQCATDDDYSSGSGSEEDDNEDDEDEEEVIEAVIPKFPVEVICMEYCEKTFDYLIMNEKLSVKEWNSALMQIIMILITYQKAFSFTHNDLHTNNVMYNHTDKKYISYYYENKYYQVPTYGRIFKIIDFGRSIYKYDGKVFCSDSFKFGGDAATQYNIEPYFDDTKPRLEPNFSFDLCRLACSIFDHIIDDISETKNLAKCDPVQRLIVEWCLDDKGVNMLYKNNGDDRYPDFKLYKMIARHVHNHTPHAQLERPEFKSFIVTAKPKDFIDINAIPVCV